MSESLKKLEEFLADEPSSDEKRQKWSGFVESAVINFFEEHKIEKLSIEDGIGNKAKLTRNSDNGIKTEYYSTVIL